MLRLWGFAVSSASSSPDHRGPTSRRKRRGSFSMSPRTRRRSVCSRSASERQKRRAEARRVARDRGQHSRAGRHLTAAGEVEVVNHELVEYCGQPLEAMRQWGTNGTVHPDDLPHVGQVFTQSIAAGTSLRLRGTHSAVGRRLPLVSDPWASASRYERGYRPLVCAPDRHRRAQARRGRSAASERNLKLIIDTIPALAWSARPDGSAEFFNQHYLDFIGLSAEQASGWGWTAAVHPDD